MAYKLQDIFAVLFFWGTADDPSISPVRKVNQKKTVANPSGQKPNEPALSGKKRMPAPTAVPNKVITQERVEPVVSAFCVCCELSSGEEGLSVFSVFAGS